MLKWIKWAEIYITKSLAIAFFANILNGATLSQKLQRIYPIQS